jgi:hypothetical protein
MAYVERFDVENMNTALDAYLQLIETIKGLADSGRKRNVS